MKILDFFGPDKQDKIKESFKSENEAGIVETDADGYTLIELDQQALDENAPFVYVVLDAHSNDKQIAEWNSNIDAQALPLSEYNKCMVRRNFRRVVNDDKAKKEAGRRAKVAATRSTYSNNNNRRGPAWLYADDDDDWEAYKSSYSTNASYYGYNNAPSYDRSSYYSAWTPNYISEEEAMKKYNNTDTLVIHKTDPTTTMLDQIYKGKGWDVINKVSEISKDTLHKLLESHERIIMLGHGSSYGLIGSVDPSCAPYLKGKKMFVIWCNADAYFTRYLPDAHGFFCTKNAPSEVGECVAAGCGNISAELMLENITYWCKLCGDVVEQALDGNVNGAVDYVRKNYLEKYGNHPVSIFNADSAHNKGYNRPLPNYEFKGEPLTPKDYPYPNFDEEEFLKNPVPYAKK